MKSSKSKSDLKYSRAVEEPIEATFELGEDLQKHSGKLEKFVKTGILGSIVTILFFAGNFIFILDKIYGLAQGNISLSASELALMLILFLLMVLLTAMTVTVMLYLIQVHKFYKHLEERYRIVTNLKNVPSDVGISGKIGGKLKNGKGKEHRFVKNPIFATLDLVEEAMHELPQLIRMLKISKYFMVIILAFININIILNLGLDTGLFFVVNYKELIFNLVMLVLFIPAVLLLQDLVKLFTYLGTRHDIIDSIKFGENIVVPPGKDEVARLVKYLDGSDPFIMNSPAKNTGWSIGAVKKQGRSGKTHEFDAYFSTTNNLYELSEKLCIPKGRLAVFIKVLKPPVSVDALDSFKKAVLDVSAAENSFPLRAIAVQKDIGEVDDDAYEFALEQPISIECCLSHIQIAAEDGDIYSFIPQMSYGKGPRSVGPPDLNKSS